jgi:hypothetical protein
MITRLSAKLLTGTDKRSGGKVIWHWCPGCEQAHVIDVEKPNHCNAIWSWDGNAESPTFAPSINYVGACHYFIQQGNIQFCSDSQHALAGQTVPLPDFPDKLADAWEAVLNDEEQS